MQAPRQINSALQSLVAQRVLIKADACTDTDRAGGIAAMAAAAWLRIAEVVAPLIGMRGLQVLYLHSLRLTSRIHPCLTAADTGPDETAFERLKTLLADCGPREALAAANALLINFIELLATLIGESLTEQLLLKAWQDGPPQENRRQADHHGQ